MKKKSSNEIDLPLNDYKSKYKNFILDANSSLNQVPTCSRKLNFILGGGLQEGKVVEIYGHEGSGKSSLSMSICADILKKRKDSFACIIDTEGGICSVKNLDEIGIIQSRTLIMNISEGERVFNVAEDVVKDKKCAILIIDSVASILTEEDMADGSSSLGSHARLISKRLRKLIGVLNENSSKTVVILINQIRNKINDLWKGETNYTTTGGKALKYYASLRLEMDRNEYIKEKEKRIGFYARIKVIKSRMSVPFCECYIPFLYGKGFSQIVETIDILVDHDFIEKNGSWLHFAIEEEKYSFRSKWELINNCIENKEFFAKILKISNSYQS